MQRTFNYKVGGKTVEIVLDSKHLRPSEDLDSDAAEVANLFGQLAQAMAESTAQLDRTDAEYRRFRATETQAILEADPKAAEWKCKASIEASDAFLAFKMRMAEINGDIEFLRAYQEGLRTKAAMIKVRASMDSTGRAMAGSGSVFARGDRSRDDDEPRGRGRDNDDRADRRSRDDDEPRGRGRWA